MKIWWNFSLLITLRFIINLTRDFSFWFTQFPLSSWDNAPRETTISVQIASRILATGVLCCYLALQEKQKQKQKLAVIRDKEDREFRNHRWGLNNLHPWLPPCDQFTFPKQMWTCHIPSQFYVEFYVGSKLNMLNQDKLIWKDLHDTLIEEADCKII